VPSYRAIGRIPDEMEAHAASSPVRASQLANDPLGRGPIYPSEIAGRSRALSAARASASTERALLEVAVACAGRSTEHTETETEERKLSL